MPHDLVDDFPQPVSSMRRDLASAYAASLAKVVSFAVVLSLLYRYTNEACVSLFVVARSMLGLLQYLFLNVATAFQQLAAVPVGTRLAVTHLTVSNDTFDYAADALPPLPNPDWQLLYTARCLAITSSVVGGVSLWFYANYFRAIHDIHATQNDDGWFILAFGTGLLLRNLSEPSSAALQFSGRISRDNIYAASIEMLWMLASIGYVIALPRADRILVVGQLYAVTGAMLAAGRWIATSLLLRPERRGAFSVPVFGELMRRGVVITAGSLADFLYAPTNVLIINRVLQSDLALAAYAPALQVDAALLLLVSGLAAVMLPKSAVAHAAGDHATLRRYYVRGTLVSLGLLAAAAGVVAIFSQTLLTLWLKNPPALARPILLLVLIHTVIGGSAGVGRSILLSTGHAKAYTVAAIAGGVLNICLALSLVKFTSLGLYAIPFATIIAVTLRCAVWQPMYVMRVLRLSRDTTPSS